MYLNCLCISVDCRDRYAVAVAIIIKRVSKYERALFLVKKQRNVPCYSFLTRGRIVTVGVDKFTGLIISDRRITYYAA